MATDEIVVGVDGSAGSAAALQWAVDQASRTGGRVVAVQTWEYPFVGDLTGSVAMPDPSYMQEGAQASVQRVVEKVVVPDGVRLDIELVEGLASRALIDRAAGAAMLVVGSRGHGGFMGLLVGSVATQCVNHATVPVVVVPVAAPVR
jgi:nucleotide-binding universal stress UspA family protein